MLGPQLSHNVQETARLVRLKRTVAVIGVLLVFPVALVAGEAAVLPAVIGLFVLIAVAFVYLDFRRVLVFRRDLQERAAKGTSAAAGGPKESNDR